MATSAFGLGIDQADVRAVIHVCVPETIDRFYQEVGRGGRDGRASISLMLYTETDIKIARGINENSAITVERGLQRWQNMFANKTPLSDGRFRVPTDTPPSLLPEDIDMRGTQNKANRAWNIRTLTLMNRAGLIEIDFEEPPLKKSFELEEIYNQAWENYRNHKIISIRNQSHLDKVTWEFQVEPIRLQRQSWSYKNINLMIEALKAKRCISKIFQEAYTISFQGTEGIRNKVTVSRTCGGCPVCREKRVKPFAGIMPEPSPVLHNKGVFVGEELERLLWGENLLLIFYDSLEEKGKKRQINRVFRWLLEQNIKNVIAPDQFREHFIKEVNLIQNGFIFWWSNYQPLKMPCVATFIFHSPGEKLPLSYISKNSMPQAPRIILLSIDTPDPNRNDRKMIDVFSGRHFKFDSFCTEIGV
ncbi:MAG: hypothetical protein KME29_08330 [Calothrix sp. FI2-JRJ7]|nr:hypothetical protein [Calothrix sp. FI2-JRJ7]